MKLWDQQEEAPQQCQGRPGVELIDQDFQKLGSAHSVRPREAEWQLGS